MLENNIVAFVFLIVCLFTGRVHADAPDFAKDVAPILNKYCVGCHSADDPEADLVLTSHEAILKGGENGSAINGGELDKSLLISRVTGAVEPIMPPEDEPRPNKEEIAKLVAWVAAGAKKSTAKVDSGVARFPDVKPAGGPTPITALAYTGGDQIIIVGELEITGIDIHSAEGLLVPVPDPPGSAPFTFFLSNTKEQITYGNLGTTVKLDGELRLAARYLGPKDGDDLKVTWGIGPVPKPAKFKFDEVVAVGRFGAVELYTDDSESLLKTPGKVHGLQFSSDGKLLLAASGVAGVRGEAILWDARDGKLLKRFKGHRDAVYAAAISDDAKLVATGSYDRQIILWDAESGEQLRTLKGHNGAIYDLDFSPDAKVVVSASADATIKVWNVQTGERLDTLNQPLKEQYSVDVSPDGKHIVAGGEDNRIRLWDLVSVDSAKINPIREARFAHEGAIENVRYVNGGKRIVSSSTDGTVKIWDANSLSLVKAYDKPKNSSSAFAISGDQDIVVGTLDANLKSFSLDVERKEQDGTSRVVKKPKVTTEQETTEYKDTEPNESVSSAQAVQLPATITGVIHRDGTDADRDHFKFKANAGEQWIFEVKAARDKSPLDSHIAILDDDGKPVPRVQLQATRDTYFTFRGKDSNGTGDFRLHNWEEMQLNQLLYSSGEVVKLFHYPRGPDSGFNVYPNFGSRRGFFDTTPVAHALHEPAYIVEPHPPGVELPPNGLPVFVLNYENDDDSQRLLGDDSRLTFVAPKDGDYVVAIRDVRGHQGNDFNYSLMARVPKPNFKGKVLNKDPKVGKGAGKKFGIEVERIDGFAGPIDVTIENLPEDFEVPGPLEFEVDHDRVWGTLLASDDAELR